jgi:hypothetical protein
VGPVPSGAAPIRLRGKALFGPWTSGLHSRLGRGMTARAGTVRGRSRAVQVMPPSPASCGPGSAGRCGRWSRPTSTRSSAGCLRGAARSLTSPGPLAAETAWVVDTIDKFRGDQVALDDPSAARMLAAVHATEGMRRADAESHCSLWRDLTRRAPAEVRTPAATMLAFSSWLAGNGADHLCVRSSLESRRLPQRSSSATEETGLHRSSRPTSTHGASRRRGQEARVSVSAGDHLAARPVDPQRLVVPPSEAVGARRDHFRRPTTGALPAVSQAKRVPGLDHERLRDHWAVPTRASGRMRRPNISEPRTASITTGPRDARKTLAARAAWLSGPWRRPQHLGVMARTVHGSCRAPFGFVLQTRVMA